MKTSHDPRHIRRREIIKTLFASTYVNQHSNDATVKAILKQLVKIDKKISKAAPAWPTEKLNKIDLSILRLAIFELQNKKIPPKVVIDEAVELAKEFGSENSAAFVNGVLGAIYTNKNGN